MIRYALIAVLSLALSGGFPVDAQQPSSSPAAPPLKRIELPRADFVPKELKDRTGAVRKYVVYVPPSYRAERAWPAILFLHGMGERGRDGMKQCTVGLGPAVAEYGGSFPFIAMFPQDVEFDRTDDDLAMAILDATQREYRIDPERVYLTGLSMGGAGTWRLAARYPDRFAAIAPVCGRTEPELACNVLHLPAWCFHGDADPVIPPAESREMIAALKKLGAEPRYTEYPGVTHNSWDKAYGTRELYSWMLEHRRKLAPKQITYAWAAKGFETPLAVWWLRINAIDASAEYGRVEAKIVAKGELAVKTRGAKRLTILLNAGPFGNAKEWSVNLNGELHSVRAEDGRIVLNP